MRTDVSLLGDQMGQPGLPQLTPKMPKPDFVGRAREIGIFDATEVYLLFPNIRSKWARREKRRII